MPRVGVFDDKDHGTRIQGIMTKVGRKAFDAARLRLSDIYHEIMGVDIAVSDGDTAEFLARGDSETRKYLKARAAKRS